ncbi:MAG: hypothetical protein ACKVK6_12780, partial [bacterium]
MTLNRFHTLLLAALLVSTNALAASKAENKCIPIVLLYDENEELAERHTDTNRDCAHDELVFYEGGKAARSQRDRDHNGEFDSWSHYNELGQVHLRELDTNGDGKPDSTITYQDEVPILQRDDDNADGEVDIITQFVDGEASKRDEDQDHDGKFDRFTTYLGGKPSILEEDRDRDGRIDLHAEFDLDGSKLLEHQDNTQDGALNVSLFFRDGKQIRVEEDTTGDRRKDVITYYNGLLVSA